jgi:putative aldouronate transport system permease protein
MSNRLRRESKNDKIFLTLIYIILWINLMIIVFPLIYIISASFSSPDAVTAGKVVLWPVDPSILGYTAIFRNNQVLLGYANSAFYTFFGTLLNVTLTVMAAYPLSRKDFYGGSFIMLAFTFTMLFSGGLIPLYLLVRNLGMIDTRWSMLIPSAMSVYYVIIARTFFQGSIPGELVEATYLDGCSDFKFVMKIVLPLSAPLIAVLALFYSVGQWNTYFNALIFLKTPSLYPLQIVLRNIMIQNIFDPTMLAQTDAKRMMERQGMRTLLKYSLIVVASLPVIIIYPFVQKYFVKGIMIGSIKG